MQRCLWGKTHGACAGSSRHVEIFSSTLYLIPWLVQTPPALEQDSRSPGGEYMGIRKRRGRLMICREILGPVTQPETGGAEGWCL